MKTRKMAAMVIVWLVANQCDATSETLHRGAANGLRKRAIPASSVMDDLISHTAGSPKIRHIFHEVASQGRSALDHLLAQGRTLEDGAHSVLTGSSSTTKPLKRLSGLPSIATAPPKASAKAGGKKGSKSMADMVHTSFKETPRKRTKVVFNHNPSVRTYNPPVSHGSNQPTRSTTSVNSPYKPHAAAEEEAVKPLAERSKKEQWFHSLHDHPFLYYSTVTGGLMAGNAAVAHHYVHLHENEVLEAKKKLGLPPIDISGEIKEVKENLEEKRKALKGKLQAVVNGSDTSKTG
jgi:hypothetical protein